MGAAVLVAMVATVGRSPAFCAPPEGPNLQFLSERAWQGTEVSIAAINLESGREVVFHHADRLMNPASNAKLLTMVCAFEELGPGFRFETSLYSEDDIESGSIHNLWVKGGGDPSLTSERLWKLANDLYQMGLGTINGDIIIDGTFFDSADFPGLSDFFQPGDPLKLGAFSVNFNTATVHVRGGPRPGVPPHVSIEPMVGYPLIANHAVTTAGGRQSISVSNTQVNGQEVIHVNGKIPSKSDGVISYRGVFEPERYAGWALKGVLEQHGITVKGGVKAARLAPHLKPIHVYHSPALGEIARDMGKHSNNFTAEQVLKVLGGIKLGAPASSQKGLQVLRQCLARHGFPEGSYTLENGSGLSRKTRLTTGGIVRLLADAWNNREFGPEFFSSLSLGGIDGTIQRRFKAGDIKGRVRGKTGSLNGVTALSGYLETETGKLVAFSIIANGARKPSLERIVLELARY